MASLVQKSLRLHPKLATICSVRCFNSQLLMHSITPKVLRDPDYYRLPPLDYKHHKLNWLENTWDSCSARFDENTKIIVVDGPFGSGKKEVCQALAEALDFYWIKDPCIDQYFIDPRSGFDMRDHDYLVNNKPLDLQKFWRNPFDERVMLMQQCYHKIRYFAYVLALRHIFHTGQGVVMNRSIYSNLVNVAAMVGAGFLPKRYLTYYEKLRCCQFGVLKRPHLNIYLDVPMEVCMDRIRKRNCKHEAQSKFYTEELFASFENYYKENFYNRANMHAEMIIMDWKENFTFDDILHEVEKVEFLDPRHSESKQQDWNYMYEKAYRHYRWDTLYDLLNYVRIEDQMWREDLPEIWPEYEKMTDFHDLKLMGEEYLDKDPGRIDLKLFTIDKVKDITDETAIVDDVREKYPEKLSINIFNDSKESVAVN